MTNHSLPSGPGGGAEGDSEKRKWGYKRHQFDAVISKTRFNGAIDNLAAGRVETRAIIAILDELNASNQRGRYMAEVLALKQESRRLATVEYSERVAQFLMEGSRRIPYLSDGLASQMAVALASAADNPHYLDTVNAAVSNLLLDLDRPLKSDTRNYLRALTDKIDATRRLQEARGHLATVPSVYPPIIPESLANAQPSPEPPPVDVGVAPKRTLAFGAPVAPEAAPTADDDDESTWEEDESVDSALEVEDLRAAHLGDHGAATSEHREAERESAPPEGSPRLSASRTLSGTGAPPPPVAKEWETSPDELAAAKTKAAMRAALESSPGRTTDPSSRALEEAFFASGDAASAETEAAEPSTRDGAAPTTQVHSLASSERDGEGSSASASPSKPKLRRAKRASDEPAEAEHRAATGSTQPGIGETPSVTPTKDIASGKAAKRRDREAGRTASDVTSASAAAGATQPSALSELDSAGTASIPTSRVPWWLVALAIGGIAASGVGFWILMRGNNAVDSDEAAASASGAAASPSGAAAQRKAQRARALASARASAVAAPTPEPPAGEPPPPPPPPPAAVAPPPAPVAPAPTPVLPAKLPKANSSAVVRTPPRAPVHSAPAVAKVPAAPKPPKPSVVPATPKPPKPVVQHAEPKQPKPQPSVEPKTPKPVATATAPIEAAPETPVTPKPSRTIDDILAELRQVPNDAASIELKAHDVARVVARAARADAEHILRRMIPEEILAGSETLDTRLLEPVRRVVALLLKKVALDKDDTRAAMAIDALGEWAKLRKHGAAAKLTLDELAEERVILARPPRLRALERVQARLGISNAGE